MENSAGSKRGISRRSMLVLAGSAAAGVGLAAENALAQTTPQPGQEIVGSWLAGQNALRTAARLLTFNAEGTVNVTYPQVLKHSAAHGSWTNTADHEFLTRLLSFQLDDGGNVAGLYDIRADITVAQDGNSYTGTLVERQFDPSGNLLNTSNANLQSIRISTMPL